VDDELIEARPAEEFGAPPAFARRRSDVSDAVEPPEPDFKAEPAELRKAIACRHNVRATAVALDTKRNDRGMLEKQQKIRHALRAALLDEGPLELKRVLVGNRAEAADFERAHYTWLGSKFSIPFLMSDMN